jgi:phosphoribosyl-AMP cyclohydrolase
MEINEIKAELEKLLDFGKLSKFFGSNKKEGILPAVAQNSETGEILIVGHANSQAIAYALKKRIATFWSVSRNELWIKGAEESGNFLDISDILIDCEGASIIYLVKLRKGRACHTKDEDGQNRISCFFRGIQISENQIEIKERRRKNEKQ